VKSKKLWKLFTYVPFLVVVVLIGIIQTFMLVNEQVKPYPEPFGRATELPYQATTGEPVSLLSESVFAYQAGQALEYARIDEEGRNHIETRSLPDTGMMHSVRFVREDNVIWIGEGNQLYASQWVNGAWSPKNLLIDSQIEEVQSIVGLKGETILLASNESILYVGAYLPTVTIKWSKLDIPNMQQLKAIVDEQGDLSLVYSLNIEATQTFHYAKLASETWLPMVQHPLKSLELVTSSLDDLALGYDGSKFLAAYTTSSRKTGKSSLHMLTFPKNQTDQVSDEALNIPVNAGGIDSDTILHPAFTHAASGEASFVVTSGYEKNRRFSSQEVHQLIFKDGKLASTQRISQFDGFAEYPGLSIAGGKSLSTWLDPINAESFRVYYATDQPSYQERMNAMTSQDIQKAAENLPLLWGIALLTSLLSLKWIVLPGLYLIVISVFWQYHYDANPKLHFGISLAMYLAVKAAFISDFRKNLALQVMPDMLQSIWFHLLVLIIFAAISYVSTRIWRTGLDDRNVGLEMFYYVMLDVCITNVWYAFFMSPATL
jgi:hypothetical protein